MGFFKEFKEDLSQAVTDIIPEEEKAGMDAEKDLQINTFDRSVDMESELSKLNGLLEQAAAGKTRTETAAPVFETRTRVMEEPRKVPEVNFNQMVTEDKISNETTVITEGTSITGDMATTGSMDVRGHIRGNLNCNGKLIITGILEGNCDASEFFADAAKVEGEVSSTGTVKIGVGSVVIGNITATSAVIAGAIKGDIDVQGPVIVDSSAVIMGNIKSKSVQINNGAVIEGFCSQSYSDVDVKGLFEAKKV